ncbi:MAG TPA: beta-ketoacyl-ACP synthase I [Lentisphaeria bacterium]|nr:MAG: hypothetical protein A2X47_04370 [Lentisphaerae bacterium GWF2_38_69]HBM16226.1 beta-ketoacyl-ACP synthase I [Lentisphaeria bacterium]
MRNKVVVTGRGLVTPLGVGLEPNENALRTGKSGIVFVPEWRDLGIESNVGGLIDEKKLVCPLLDKRTLRYTPVHAMFGIVAAYEALQEAGLETNSLRHRRMAVVLGHGGSAHTHILDGAETLMMTHKSKRISPFTVPKVMPSSAVANISLVFGIKGESYSISSACASSAHAITVASRLLQAGLYDIVLTGGTEELNWIHGLGFDAMRALSRSFNDTPERASRPFDKARDGFVIACGSGMMVLETEEHARKRNAKIFCQVSGMAGNSNATDMVFPDAPSCSQVMNDALNDAGLTPADINYINTHGTSTPVGDPIETNSIKSVFYDTNKDVLINSTKCMTGHMIGATGAAEIIFTSLMMEKEFISPNINLENIEDECAWANLPREIVKGVKIKHALKNCFGFGGTNSCVILSAIE